MATPIPLRNPGRSWLRPPIFQCKKFTQKTVKLKTKANKKHCFIWQIWFLCIKTEMASFSPLTLLSPSTLFAGSYSTKTKKTRSCSPATNNQNPRVKVSQVFQNQTFVWSTRSQNLAVRKPKRMPLRYRKRTKWQAWSAILCASHSDITFAQT